VRIASLRGHRKANERLAAEDQPPIPDGITFHALRRTYAALQASIRQITAAQMGHRDPRMTLRVYTDVTGTRPEPDSAAAWRYGLSRNANLGSGKGAKHPLK
jgi:integrase